MAIRNGITICVAALALAACSTSSSGQPSASSLGLANSDYHICNVGGATLAGYLQTGRPNSLDLAYGSERREVLGASGESQALLIRRYADAYISQCAQDAAQGEALAAQQAQEEAAAQAQEAQRQQVLAREQTACANVGGTWSASDIGPSDLPGLCTVTYPGIDGQPAPYAVLFNSSGEIVEGWITKATCSGTWHEATGLCSP